MWKSYRWCDFAAVQLINLNTILRKQSNSARSLWVKYVISQTYLQGGFSAARSSGSPWHEVLKQLIKVY